MKVLVAIKCVVDANVKIRIKADTTVEPLGIAKILNTLVKKEDCQLVIMGKQSIDNDNNQTGQMLAAIGNMPQGTFASLPNTMKAKRKPLETITPEELGVDITPRLTTLKVVSPLEREAGVIVSSVSELVEKLKTEVGFLKYNNIYSGDYGLIADLFDVLPELEQALS